MSQSLRASVNHGDRSLICSPKMRNKERGLHPCRPRSRYLRQRGRRGFDFVGRALHNTSSRLYSFPPVISTERSEWRDLINAPFGASGKPQRSLDYARHDKGVGDLSTTLEMTKGVGDLSTTLDMTGGRSRKT